MSKTSTTNTAAIVVSADQAFGDLRIDDDGRILGVDPRPAARAALADLAKRDVPLALLLPAAHRDACTDVLRSVLPEVREVICFGEDWECTLASARKSLDASDAGLTVISADRASRGLAQAAGAQPAPHLLLATETYCEGAVFARLVGQRRVLEELEGFVPYWAETREGGHTEALGVVPRASVGDAVMRGVQRKASADSGSTPSARALSG